jgi:hypothetical protein
MEARPARPISARKRAVLAQRLRRAAERTPAGPLRRRRQPVLLYRAAAVRTELLEIAALLEHSHNPDPACVAVLTALLANTRVSPLYNAEIHVSELHQTLSRVRSGL